MKLINQLRVITVAITCATWLNTTAPMAAATVQANGGDTFTLTPTSNPGEFADLVQGVAQVSFLGNCTFQADQLVVLPATPDQPIRVKGVWRFATSDGASSLVANVEGVGAPDPRNPAFVNIQLKAKFTHGTGLAANADGEAEINGLAMFTSAAGGTATWSLKGKFPSSKSKED
jgi:hypothetical protein